MATNLWCAFLSLTFFLKILIAHNTTRYIGAVKFCVKNLASLSEWSKISKPQKYPSMFLFSPRSHDTNTYGSLAQGPGPRFNIKMYSYQYRKSHCGDKTVVKSSYLHNGISYTGKMSSLYWISPQDSFFFVYSISQEICTRFCCALLCYGYAIVHSEFTWSIYPYLSRLLCWHWGNR